MKLFDKELLNLLKKPEGRAVAIFSILIGFYVVVILKNVFIDKKETKKTSDYIKELFIQSFSVYQEPVDVYINYGGLYSGKIQYIIGAGFNLNKSLFKNTTHKVIINLPYPEILYVYRNSDIQLSKFNKRLEYIKEIYQYGKLTAKYYSIRNNIFGRTEEYVKNTIDNLKNSLKIKFQLNFSKNDNNLWESFNSKRCNISLSLPTDIKRYFKVRNNDDILSPYCFLINSTDDKLKVFIYNSPLNLKIYPKDNNLKQFSLFYPQNEYYMEIIKETEDRRFIRYYYRFKDRVVIADFKPSDESIYQRYLPYIMLIGSLIKEKLYKDKAVRDCFGITKDIWDKGFIGDKQRYIEKYFQFLNSENIIFDRKNHVLATKKAYKELYPMVKKLSKVATKEEIRGHLVMAILNKTGRNFQNTILWVFLDNGKVIAMDKKGKRKDFSYQSLIDASLETIDLGHICLDGKYCFGDSRELDMIPKDKLKEYKAERELAKLVWGLINYGFPILYTTY